MRIVFVGRERTVWLMPVWSILTLGIYRRVWLYNINKELDGHAALGINHRLNLILLILPILGPTIVTFRTTRHMNEDLRTDTPLPYGPTWALWLGTFLLPVVGPLAHMVWSQDRLNRYWANERDNEEHGIEIDVDLSKEPKFIAELEKAREESYFAGSRFDRNSEERRERWRQRRRQLMATREERRRVRAAGGSTPVLPWLRPRREPMRNLRITCGRCELGFAVQQDPYAETPVLCPRCGLSEVLPSLRGNALASKERGVVASLEVDCPKCETHFHAIRNLHEPTTLECFECGHKETLKPGQKVPA